MSGLPPINPPGASLQRGPDGSWYADRGSRPKMVTRKKKLPRRRPLGQQPSGVRQTGTGTAWDSTQRN